MRTIEIRENMIRSMQGSLKIIMLLTGLSTLELSELIGETKETINKLQENILNMSYTQYLAICAIVESKCREQSSIKLAINTILTANMKEDLIKEDFNYSSSLVDNWIETFNKELLEKDGLISWNKINEEMLEKVIKNYKVFLNYDVLIQENSYEFFKEFIKMMKENSSRAIIAFRSLEKIKRLKDEESKEVYINAIEIIREMKEQNVVEIRGEDDDCIDPDELISMIFEKYNIEYTIALLTQNKNLALKLQRTNKGRSILCRLTQFNELIEWKDDISKSEEFENLEKVKSYYELNEEESIDDKSSEGIITYENIESCKEYDLNQSQIMTDETSKDYGWKYV